MDEREFRQTRLITLGTSVALFICSLTQNGFTVDGRERAIGPGAFFLGLGWFSVFTSASGITWFANPLLLMSWLSFKTPNWKRSFNTSVVAMLLTLSFLFFKNIAIDEGGSEHLISSYLSGYWLWVSSCLMMVVGNLYIKFVQKK